MALEWLENFWKETQDAMSCISGRGGESAPTGNSSSFNKKSQVSVAGRLFKPAELPKSRSIDHDDYDEGEQFGAIGAAACLILRRLTASGEGRWRVMTVCPGSPAKMCGKIRAGMCLTHVDGEELCSKEPAEAALMLLGAPGSSIELSFQSCRTLEEIALLGGGEEQDEEETGEVKVGEEAGSYLSSTAEASAGEKTITIDVTIQRMDPAEFVNEEEDMVRFRRLGCTRNSLNIRV